jgi:hypothetical protein
MGTRLELQQLLVGALGSNNVYFQPPPSFKILYPCIIYELYYQETRFSDNLPYFLQSRYIVTVVDKNPDSLIPNKIAKLKTCVFDRFYTMDNLNHTVYKLFY